MAKAKQKQNGNGRSNLPVGVDLYRDTYAMDSSLSL